MKKIRFNRMKTVAITLDLRPNSDFSSNVNCELLSNNISTKRRINSNVSSSH